MDNRSLRRGNALLAFVHVAQAAVILALATDFSLPVTGAFMEAQPGSGVPKQDLLFDLRIGPLVAAFLLLAALDHALVALPPFRARYERCLAAGVNPFRWLEYSLSASLMVVLIAMLTGIADYVALLALFAVNAAMIFFGWLMELLNPPDRVRTRWLRSCSAASSAPSHGSRSPCRSASRRSVDMRRRRSSMRSSFRSSFSSTASR